MAKIVTLNDDGGFTVKEAGADPQHFSSWNITQGQITDELRDAAILAACTPVQLRELRARAAAYRPPF